MMLSPKMLTAEEAVLLDRLFRHGPQQPENRQAALALVEKGFARQAGPFGTLEITEFGRRSAGIYKIGDPALNDHAEGRDAAPDTL
ncbi:hypothetical protein [Jiella sonneratiae]|uniref:DUF3253 domain-containing protein n=1 Tax=Jiella sonneratiae TaxID=2816856 RepID=A0ABS3J7F4_9HYPH|nr:hypothetical protein [Jiella sonneratiae]MBO0905616.1 hypothetical protein [Jiella sonneratiae]